MKFMNFSRADDSSVRLGCELGQHCLDVTGAITAGHIRFNEVSSIEEALRIEGGIGVLEKQLHGLESDLSGLGTDLLLPASELRLRQTVFHPEKIIGIGLNYHDHADEVAMTRPEQPLLFAMFANTIIGPGESIIIPEMSDQIDFEAEMGVVIGRRGRHIPVEEAIEHVAGYTIVNDVSARDLQFSDNQWIRGKSFDTFAPIGPCLVTTSAGRRGRARNLSSAERGNDAGFQHQQSHLQGCRAGLLHLPCADTRTRRRDRNRDARGSRVHQKTAGVHETGRHR